MYKILTEQEHKLVFELDKEDRCKTAFIGYVRGDFGKNGDEFWHTWFGNQEDKNSSWFKEKLRGVVEECRRCEEHLILKDYKNMSSFCYKHPEVKLPNRYCEKSSAVRMEADGYVFYIRLVPVLGDYNFRIYCYDSAVLNILEDENGRDEE